ncbi:MAG: Ig-like domain-containing protein [Kofleriaceae bacterium]
MSRVAWILTAAVLWPTLAVAGPVQTGPFEQPNWSVLDPSIARGYALPPPGSAPVEPPAAAATVSNIIYLNRCAGGCTITKTAYPNSSSLNNTTWIGGQGIPEGTSYTISEFAFSQAVWDEFVTCVKDVYRPYDVQIVTDDPGNVPHHEAIVAGRSSEAGLSGGILGQAELGAGFCAPKDNAISFNFANDHNGIAGLSVAENLCWTVAQETAHSWGLDHEFDCHDALTYVPGLPSGGSCGIKFFRNSAFACGENAARPCVCGGSTQNSHQKILTVFGAGTGPQLLPTMNITAPTNGSMFPAGNSVVVSATSRRGMSKVEVYINGWKWTEKEGAGPSYVVSVPAGVPDGVMDIKARACDDIDVCAEQTVTVTRGAPCANADACLAGQKCEAGKCFWDPPSVELGGACTIDQECLSLQCSDIGGGVKACAVPCQGGPNDFCPEGFSCTGATGQAGVCALDGGGDDGGGCCSVDRGGSSAPVLINLGLGAAVALLVARRRRKAA